MSDQCGSCSGRDGCASADSGQGCQDAAEMKLRARLARIRHKLVVLSGKGGVGKTTLAVNLALGLAMAGKTVGLLDVDVHGPSVPRLLGLKGEMARMSEQGLEPVAYDAHLRVMSLAFLLPDDKEAVVWRGPLKMGVIRQFLSDVEWGDLDYLVVDCPPGTGDEPLSVLQLLGQGTKAVVVTTPQGVAVDDVRRSISFCEQTGTELVGLIENMSGFVCPGCKERHELFPGRGGEHLAMETGARLLARLPFEPALAEAEDAGISYLKVAPHSVSAQELQAVVGFILNSDAQA